jgi:hypothetical protein
MIFSAVIASVCVTSAYADSAKHQNHSNNHQAGQAMSFAIIGDGPYGDDKEIAYDRMIKEINADNTVQFVIHVGDIKSGGTECTDERLTRRFEQLQQIRTPVVYTPGDNEWTDCHRASNGAWNPLERLSFIRQLFFPNPGMTTGQNPQPVLSQSSFSGYEKFVENAIGMAGPVMISTIHVVGSNNNLNPWSGIDANDSIESPRADRLQEYTERNAASLHWLDTTFQKAIENNAAGIFIAIHADPNFELNSEDKKRNGFNDFLSKLLSLTNTFDRPVVIAHGDSHLYRVDKPRLTPWYRNGDATDADNNPLTPQLTRLEVFGDSDVHWVKVNANASNEEVFNFAPRIVKSNLPE